MDHDSVSTELSAWSGSMGSRAGQDAVIHLLRTYTLSFPHHTDAVAMSLTDLQSIDQSGRRFSSSFSRCGSTLGTLYGGMIPCRDGSSCGCSNRVQLCFPP